MSSVKVVRQSISWSLGVLREFAATDYIATWSVVSSIVVGRIAHVLAFFLPLKVILLLGSNSVPRYFQSFVSQEDKLFWVTWLSIAAVGFYILSLLADAVATHQTARGSSTFAAESELSEADIATVENYFVRFCRGFADLIVTFSLLIIGVFINAGLFLSLILLLNIQVWLTLYLFLRSEDSGRFKTHLLDDFNTFTSTLGSVNFLLVFGFLLAVFLLGDGLNILIAILSILVTRQLLTSMQSACNELVYLSRQRTRVDALFSAFPDNHQTWHHQRDLVQIFSGEKHLLRIRSSIGDSAAIPIIRWRDSGSRKLYAFTAVSGSESHLELVYPPQQKGRAQEEFRLLEHLSHERLGCLPTTDTFEFEQHQIRLLAMSGNLESISSDRWPLVRNELLYRHWSIEPPPSLAGKAAGRSLGHRVNEDSFMLLELALNQTTETTYRSFSDLLPEIRERIRNLPLGLYNAGLSRGLVFSDESGGLFTSSWADWSVEPLGAGLPVRREELAWLKTKPQICKTEHQQDDIVLAACLWQLELLLKRKSLEPALKLLPLVLKTAQRRTS